MYRGAGLLFLIMLIQGCAALEEPRWAMLGDTESEAYFIDRKSVKRLQNGTYHFPVRVNDYKDDSIHTIDDSHDTNRVLFYEVSCRKKRWKEAGRGVMDKEDNILFKHLTPLPASNSIKPGTIHYSAYNYLCRNESLAAIHNH
ncbi:MAG: hypothetical protein GWO23_20300 [Gammaproteobacteria bacterium]|nr:hypothetical protein [Gammaproteobacteria bacterium]